MYFKNTQKQYDPYKRKATRRGGFNRIIWHLASFPQSSIIAATGLDFCVRNENRYFPSAMGTKLAKRQPS